MLKSAKFVHFSTLLFTVALTLAAYARSGEAEQAQPYEKIRYPTFSKGRLQTMLEADQAEAYDVAAGTPRINLKNVVVTLYDDSEESLRNTPEDQPLPPKMIITSDRGYFTRRPPEPGTAPEEIANLEGNVVLRQMRVNPNPPPSTLRPRRLDPSIETEIRCHHAQWNNTLRKLNGDGEVEFLQEDSRIVGTGFLYLADDEAMDSSGSGGSNIREWGGIVFIEHNARMEIFREGESGASGLTEITCRDTASYKLREREIQFERDVKVRRRGLAMDADILKVILRREDEPPTPRRPGSEGDAGTPGEVKSIIATIGKRPGSVVITGSDPDQPGGMPLFTARGGRADFDLDTNRLTLTDSRTDQVPRIDFGRDRISDRTLEFLFVREERDASKPPAGSGIPDEVGGTVLDTLTASGGQGQVYLSPRQTNSANDRQLKPMEISYKGTMDYSRLAGRIRFRDSVFLKYDDLRIRSESLDVRMTRSAGSTYPDMLQRVVAETDVSINTADREARAQRAEYDLVSGTAPGQNDALDVLRLFGPPQGTPPHPWVRDADGNQITAPIIHMQRQQTGPGERPRHLLHATGGTATAEFHTTAEVPGERDKVITIKCEEAMEYNEAKGLAWFAGQVMANSDAPEDNYIMTSDRLDIYMVERPHPVTPDKFIVRLRRIDANGNARMMQDARICEANQIIRDFPTERLDEGDIYLEGAPAQGDRPPRMAVYREQIGAEVGSMFAAPRIMASAKGDLIRANGPGQLSMPDEIPGFRSEIIFDGAARYESFHDGMASEAKFRRGVVLRQPSRRLVVTAEEMDSRFMRDGPLPERQEDRDDIDVERIGRLRRVEARVAVQVTHGTEKGEQVVVADKGVVELTDSGNVITMSAERVQDPRRWVYVRRYDGLNLRSPQIEIRELQGITRAAGPGELQIPGDGSAEGLSKVPTRVLFGEKGSMVYNELAMNIKVSDDVRIVQPGAGNNWSFPSLDGRCDRLEIVLLEPPSAGLTGEDALTRVLRMDVLGGVLLRVYADPPEHNPNIDWLSRPGNTFFIRGDQGTYDVPEGRITVFSLPGRQPQLLLNMVDAGSPPRRQRLKADRFILNTNTIPRRWYFEGQLESGTLRDGEAFEFQD